MTGLLPTFSAFQDVDSQLRRLVGLVVRDFVNKTWYANISADESFPAEVTLVLSKVCSEMERRFRKVDHAQLMLVDLPYAIEQHFVVFRQAKAAAATSLGGGHSTADLFHRSMPHVALDDPHYLDEYLRELSAVMLKYVLPPDEHDSVTIRLLVREILCGVVLKNAVSALTEPDFLNGLIVKVVEGGQQAALNKQAKRPGAHHRKSGSWLQTVKRKWRGFVKSVGLLADVTVRMVRQTRRANQTRTSYYRVDEPMISLLDELLQIRRRDKSAFLMRFYEFMCRPILRFFGGAAIDQFLVALVDRFTSPPCVALYLDTLTSALWPGGTFIKGAPKLTALESQQLRSQAEMLLLGAVPSVSKVLISPIHLRDVMHEHTLEFFQSAERNKHLLLNLIDIIMGHLFPELTAVPRGDPTDPSLWVRNDQLRKRHHHTQVTSTTVTAVSSARSSSFALNGAPPPTSASTVSSVRPVTSLSATDLASGSSSSSQIKATVAGGGGGLHRKSNSQGSRMPAPPPPLHSAPAVPPVRLHAHRADYHHDDLRGRVAPATALSLQGASHRSTSTPAATPLDRRSSEQAPARRPPSASAAPYGGGFVNSILPSLSRRKSMASESSDSLTARPHAGFTFGGDSSR
ncbi:hypothetical protein RI367_001802 [Sorochytrium milnesiophthora]